MAKRKPNDQRSDVKNQNNIDHKLDRDNHSNIHNPNNPKYNPNCCKTK